MSILRKNNSILVEKKYFPCSVEEIFHRINISYTLSGKVKSSSIIKCISFGNAEQDSLFVMYNQTDFQLRKIANQGVTAILSDHKIEDIPCIIVQNLWECTRKLAKSMYEMMTLETILVAGSEGKTTTKRMINSVLQTEKKVYYEYNNYNIMLSLCGSLSKIKTNTEIFVREADESGKQSLVNYSNLLNPHIAVVTNIAEAHISVYGSQEALVSTFLGITKGMKENGIIIINGDDENSVKANFKKNVIRIGIDHTDCECVAKKYRESKRGAEFDICFEGETEHISLSVHGVHNVYNAMMAFVVGKIEGISTNNIKKGLLSYSNSGIRQNICRLGKTLVYADCYNASATSDRFALKCFSALPSRKYKKVAVLGDIAEIEGFEENTYRSIASALDDTDIDVLVTCGKDSEMIHSFVTRDIKKIHAKNIEELNYYLKKLKRQGGGNYLFKASRIMKLEKSIRSTFPYHYKWIKIREKLHF